MNKTKILVFGDRLGRRRHIAVRNNNFEVVDSFKFLGIMFFLKKPKFCKGQISHSRTSQKSLYSLFVKIRNLDLPLDCQIKLFDNTVVPILLYACEVWGYGDLNCIEQIHTDCLKHILHVKKSIPLWIVQS